MMKEICAQCLQPHVDPATGEDDLRVLLLQPGPAARSRRLRLRSTSACARTRVQEKLTAEWIDHCLVKLDKREMQRV